MGRIKSRQPEQIVPSSKNIFKGQEPAPNQWTSALKTITKGKGHDNGKENMKTPMKYASHNRAQSVPLPGQATNLQKRPLTKTTNPYLRKGIDNPGKKITIEKRNPNQQHAPRPRRRPQQRYSRTKSGVINQIKHYQRTTLALIPKRPFVALVRELLQKVCYESTPRKFYRIQKVAVECLQEASEAYIVSLLQDSNAAALHTKRVTLMQRDIAFAWQIRGNL